MGIIRIKPDSTSLEVVTIYGGAASVHAALSDGSDTTYVRQDGLSSTILQLGLGNPSVPADSFIVSVVPGLRLKKEKASEALKAYVYDFRPGAGGSSTGWPATKMDLSTQLVSVISERALYAAQGDAVAAAHPAGLHDAARWEDVIANALFRVDTNSSQSESLRAYLYEAFADVYTLKRPTVSVTAPSGTINNTSQPVISVTVSEVIEAFQDTQPGLVDWLKIGNLDVAVYPASVYGAGGFDPAANVDQAAWSSFGQTQYGPMSYIDGTTASTQVVQVPIGTPLANSTTYRAYVRARRAATAGDSVQQALWQNEGTWAYAQFTIAVTPASAPGLSVGAPGSYGDPQLYVTTPANPGSHTNLRLEIQRTADSGATWQPVLGSAEESLQSVPFSDSLDLNDLAPPRGVALKYRARVISTAAGYELASAWTAPATTVTVPVSGWHFKTFRDPWPLVMNAQVIGHPEERVNLDRAVFRPKGRKYPVVVRGTQSGYDGSYTIHIEGLSIYGTPLWTVWEKLLAYQGRIAVDEAFGTQKWIEIVGEPQWIRKGTLTAPIHELTFGYVEVEAPA